MQRARELIFSGRLVGGAEAAASASPCAASPDELDAEVASRRGELHRQVAARARGAKRQINGGLGLDTPSGVEHERTEFIRYLREPHSDAIEGFRAGREGRPPSWA